MRSDRLVIAITVVVVLVAVTIFAFNFFAAPEGENQLVYLALFGAPIAITLFFMPRLALVLLGALVYSIDWLSDYWSLVPREATWLIDILLWLLILRNILLLPSRKHKMSDIEKLVYVALAFAILSALVNGLGRATVLIGLRVGFRYLLLFLAAYHLQVSRQWLRGFIVYLFVIGLIQTPVIIAQYSYMGWTDPDRLCGTFGWNQTPGVAIFLLTLVCFLGARAMEDRRIRLLDILLIGIMSVSPLLGEAKFYFLFLPVLLAFMIRSELLRRPAISLGLLVFGLLIVYTADYVIVSTQGWMQGRNPLTYVTRLHEVWTSEIQDPQSDRIERGYTIVSAFRLALASPKTILLGEGPGSITMSFISEGHSQKAAYFAQWGLNSSAPSIPWLLIEYGCFGTALFMLILWMIFRRGRILRHSSERDVRIYGRMLESMTFLYVAWLFYANTWQSDTMNFIYWPLAGMLVYLSFAEEATQSRFAAWQRQSRVNLPVEVTAPRT